MSAVDETFGGHSSQSGPDALGEHLASLRGAPRSAVDPDPSAASRAAGAPLGEEEPSRLRHPVAEHPAEVAPHGSGPTRTSIFPTLTPSSRPMNASGARSIPSTTVSR